MDRGMNVWGSGGAHKTYFKKVDEIVLDIFNRPLDVQPRGICDMGCGDGTFLEHLYSVIKNSTSRGAALDTHPLILVGADFNKVARRVTKQTLQRAGIPTYHVVNGDINRPAQLASDFEKLDLDMHEFFHVRSFLDHNRPYSAPANYAAGARKARSSGAFAHLGKEIPADELEENLVRHLRRWAPYTGRFGLLILELHTLPPELAAGASGKNAGGGLRWNARIFRSVPGGGPGVSGVRPGSGTEGGCALPGHVPAVGAGHRKHQFIHCARIVGSHRSPKGSAHHVHCLVSYLTGRVLRAAGLADQSREAWQADAAARFARWNCGAWHRNGWSRRRTMRHCWRFAIRNARGWIFLPTARCAARVIRTDLPRRWRAWTWTIRERSPAAADIRFRCRASWARSNVSTRCRCGTSNFCARIPTA